MPIGTTVFELKPKPLEDIPQKADRPKRYSSLDNFKREFLADLSQHNDEVRVVRGGRGGKGNMSDSMIKEREYGEDGDYKLILLVLKIIADIGFVGLPNAGKSTLLAALTRCRPKIAPYAFTTLTPNIGRLGFEKESFDSSTIRASLWPIFQD